MNKEISGKVFSNFFSFSDNQEYREIINSLPESHKWLGLLFYLKKKLNCKFKYVYGNQVREKLNRFAYDDEKGGIGVVMPGEVILIKEEKEGYLTKEIEVGRINFRVKVDPTPEESLRIFDMVSRL